MTTKLDRRRATIGLMIAALAGGCALTSCSNETSPSSSLPPADLSLLVASAQRTMTIVGRAENILVRDCMDEAGFEFYVESTANTEIPLENGFALFAGDLTPESAPDSGYGPYVDSPFFSELSSVDGEETDREFSSEAQQRNFDYFANLSADDQAAYNEAFNGGPDAEVITLEDGAQTSAEGCLTDARKEVLGEKWLDVFLTFNKLQMALAQINLEVDPGVLSATENWRACMAEAGYVFDDVSEAIRAGIALRGNSVQPTSEEINQAVADATCRASSDLASVTEQAFERSERQVIEQNLDVLLAWGELEVMILAEASQILGVTYEPAA